MKGLTKTHHEMENVQPRSNAGNLLCDMKCKCNTLMIKVCPTGKIINMDISKIRTVKNELIKILSDEVIVTQNQIIMSPRKVNDS